MDRPFRELHEIYRIVYLRAEAAKAAQEAREEEEKKSKGQSNRPTDGRISNQNKTAKAPLSPLEAEAFEEVFEELGEGGMM